LDLALAGLTNDHPIDGGVKALDHPSSGRERGDAGWLVQEHLETFLAQVERETGSGLPDFVREEFDASLSLGADSDTSLYLAYLECGILAHGFLRLRCADCAPEKLVAFSCKKRGFCPACGAWWRRPLTWSITSSPG
jgi:Transposase zinc-binding domain